MPTLAEQLLLVADLDAVQLAILSITDEVVLVDAERDDVIATSLSLCTQITWLANAMSDPEDETELYRSLAALWLELRFQWQRHNLVANYDTMLKGGCAPIVLARASSASYMLNRIESLLVQEHREKLGDSAVEMLDRLREDVGHSATLTES